ncbi:ATP-binding protein [Granulosicoccus sp. 3-233]|uniref:ATP-binding protein n=1 Tax=Granulosicoccus sp. 3-233 TaxID=3417969 RepID=UPI003D34C85C
MNKSNRQSASLNTVPVYPFSALQGQPRLQLALKLVAVDPRLGGVLIEGARGTAKTTSARALADILPEGEFVNLPLGASEEQLVGTLDLELVLQEGKTAFQPGLLSRAHRGVLYVDEVNLLADSLVDLLLDVCSSGVNRMERDGISHQHAADIVLIGTMNPEEGELRPQLLDRFGLYVAVEDTMDLNLRQTIVRSRLAFDDEPLAFLQAHAQRQQDLLEQLLQARQRKSGIAFTDQAHDLVSRRCHDAGVDGVRADLVMLRASRAMAALQGRTSIEPSDIETVAELVLAHRRRAESASAGPRGAAESGRSDRDAQPGDEANSQKQGESSSASQDSTSNPAQGSRPSMNSLPEGQGDGVEPGSTAPHEATPGQSLETEISQEMLQALATSSTSTSRDAGDRQWGALPAQPVPVLPLRHAGDAMRKKP